MPATQVRTPRRRKVWAGRHTFLSIDGVGPELDDLLAPTATDLGMNNMVGVTVMRVVGFMQLVSTGTIAATPAWANLRIGFAWIDERLATASGGSGLVPRPAQNGARESRWYQQFVLGGLEPSAAVATQPLNGDASSAYGRIDVDITNMQKSPTADSKFCLVWYLGGVWETNTVDLQLELDIMLALP